MFISEEATQRKEDKVAMESKSLLYNKPYSKFTNCVIHSVSRKSLKFKFSFFVPAWLIHYSLCPVKCVHLLLHSNFSQPSWWRGWAKENLCYSYIKTLGSTYVLHLVIPSVVFGQKERSDREVGQGRKCPVTKEQQGSLLSTSSKVESSQPLVKTYPKLSTTRQKEL